MTIVETCPVCGGDLVDEVICTYPAIPSKKCYKCGWSWEGEKEDVVRIPFVPPNHPWPIEWVKPTYDPVPPCCRNCSNHPRNGGSGICCCTLPYMTGTSTGGSDYITVNATEVLSVEPQSYSATNITIGE